MPRIWAFGIVFIASIAVCEVRAQDLEQISCQESVDLSEKLSAMSLFESSLFCLQEEQAFESTYLLNAGQMRAITDLKALKPKYKVGHIATENLYSILYYRFGGVGDYEVYRNEALYNSLVEKLENWGAIFGNGYNPGWQFEPVDKETYINVLEDSRANRLKQLAEYRRLYSNEEYYKLTRQMNELSQEHNNTFKVGTESYEIHNALKGKKSELRKKILSGHLKEHQ